MGMLMALFSTTLLVILLSSTVVGAAQFTVQTPAFTQCQPAYLSWNNTLPPYDILIANQSNPCGYSVADLGQITTNSVTWNVTLPGGWIVQISVEDALSDEGWSLPIIVEPSNDTSCLSPELAPLATLSVSISATPTSSSSPSSTSSATAKANTTSHAKGGSSHPSTDQIPSHVVLLGMIVVIASALFVL
ncbi:hypothetical protein BJV74DRAFT_794111 [Russula compacta]|nr:hypothetical protein BJV74DRAFT_794111 [Russula compacta]